MLLCVLNIHYPRSLDLLIHVPFQLQPFQRYKVTAPIAIFSYHVLNYTWVKWSIVKHLEKTMCQR